jgi:uncharacterized Tic20 family protein
MTDQPSQAPDGQQPPAYGQAPGAQQGYEQPQQPGYQQQGYQQAPGAQQPYSTEMSPSDQRMWAMLAHLGGILFGFLAPLIVFLVQKDRGAYVNDQSKEALNFQITLLIAYVVGSVLSIIFVGLLILFAAWIAAIVFGIMAGLAANKGENYRYPFNIRMVK